MISKYVDTYILHTYNTFKGEKLFVDRESHGENATFCSDRQEDTRCFYFGNE